MKIFGSIIAKNRRDFNDKIDFLSPQIKNIQIDIMDGEFVKNRTFSNIPDLKEYTNYFQAHLMVKDPEKYIIQLINQGIKSFIIHYESYKSKKKLDSVIELIKKEKKKVGLCINPRTSVSKLFDYVEKVDYFQIMTVNPGKYGAKFLPKTLDKVKDLRSVTKKDIYIDGSVNEETINSMSKAGANIFVVGSYFKNSKDVKKSINDLKKKII